MNKKTIVKLVVLAIILIVTIVAVNRINAKYVTREEGAGTATVARWNLQIKIDDKTNQNIVVDLADTRSNDTTSVQTGYVAPGTNGSFDIELDATGTEASLVYTLNMSTTNVPQNLKFYYDSQFQDEIIRTNNAMEVKGVIKHSAQNKVVTETIYWNWPLETGSTAEEIDANDEIDNQWYGETIQLLINVVGEQVKPDNTSPTLTLAKETYIEGFTGWTFNNSYLDSDGVLIAGENGNSASATSSYYNTNRGKWHYEFEAYTTTISSCYESSNKGGGVTTSRYFDENYELVAANGTNTSNGWAFPLELNTWQKISFKGYSTGDVYAGNMSNLMVYFAVKNSYCQPIFKLRNFRLYGEAIPNSFYLINVTSSDNEGVITTKYAQGVQTADYFNSNGEIVRNNQIRVTSNGTYTVCVIDAAGNKTIQTIEITNII